MIYATRPTKEVLDQKMIDDYNVDPTDPMQMVPKTAKYSLIDSKEIIGNFQKHRSSQLTPDQYKMTGGGEIQDFLQFNTTRIANLANSSLLGVREQLAQWYKEHLDSLI